MLRRTVRSGAYAVLLGGLAGYLGACAAGAAGPDGGTGGSIGVGGLGASGGSGGMGGGIPIATLSIAAVSPEDGSAIDATKLKPLDQVNLVVSSYPPGEHTVRFALLGAEGETPLDAVLDSSDVTTDAVTGQGVVKLTAASMPTHFQVRASALDASPYVLDVVVMKNGKATLLITPRFDPPRKSPSPPPPDSDQPVEGPSYTASAVADQTCTGLKGSPPEDGPTVANSMSFPLELEVPSDKQLAILVRIEKYAWGCTAISAAKEGPATPVEVLLTNVPAKLDGSKIEMALVLDEFPPFEAALTPYRTAVVESLRADASDDVEALLNAMQARAADPNGFENTRKVEKWDSLVRSALGANAAMSLETPLDGWLGRGLEAIGREATEKSSGIIAHLEGVANAPPIVALTKVFGFEPVRSRAVIGDEPSLSVDAADGLLIGTSMAFDPRSLLVYAARTPAVEDVPDMSTLSEALGAQVCEAASSTLTAHGCADGCTANACVKAVGDMIDTAVGSGDPSVNLDIALTSLATIGNNAELIGFSGGTWLGSLTVIDDPDAPPTNVTGFAASPVPEPEPAP